VSVAPRTDAGGTGGAGDGTTSAGSAPSDGTTTGGGGGASSDGTTSKAATSNEGAPASNRAAHRSTAAAGHSPARSGSAASRSTTSPTRPCADRSGGPPPCRVVSPTPRRAATSRLVRAGAAPTSTSASADDPRTRNAVAGALLLAVALAGSLTLRRARRTA
jgi:hypothetical protein